MVSNKTLAILVITALIFTLSGTLLSLNKLGNDESNELSYKTTGYVSAGGRVNLSITSSVSCSVPYNVSFGSGTQPAAAQILNTGIANDGGFNDCSSGVICSGILINNTGNVNVNVSFYSNTDGSTFLGTPSTAADYKYNINNGTGTSTTSLPGCVQNSTIDIGNGTWYNVPLAAAESTICGNLTFNATNKQIAIEFNATIYPTTLSGDKTSLLTITCQQVG